MCVCVYLYSLSLVRACIRILWVWVCISFVCVHVCVCACIYDNYFMTTDGINVSVQKEKNNIRAKWEWEIKISVFTLFCLQLRAPLFFSYSIYVYIMCVFKNKVCEPLQNFLFDENNKQIICTHRVRRYKQKKKKCENFVYCPIKYIYDSNINIVKYLTYNRTTTIPNHALLTRYWRERKT